MYYDTIKKHKLGDVFKTFDQENKAISELFHSVVGNSIGLPCAKNSAATCLMPNGAKKYGISSKNFLKKAWFRGNEQLFPMYQFLSQYYGSEFLHTTLQLVDLKALLSRLPTYNDEKLRRGIVQNFLMSHVSGNWDMHGFHNTAVIKPTNIIAPSFDFELCADFPATHERITNDLRDYRIGIVNKGIRPKNIEFIKTNFPEVIEEVIDKMRTLRHNPDFKDMCNFRPLEDFLLNMVNKHRNNPYRQQTPADMHKKLRSLSKRTFKTYTAKFDRIADSFAR